MNDETRALACPQCGAALAPGARSCSYCRVAVFTRHCASCFHGNLADARHCAACGRDLARSLSPAPGSLSCPACRVALEALPVATGGSVELCPLCDGQHVDHDTLRALLDHRARAPSLAPAPLPIVPGSAGPIRYLPCPACGASMNRKAFAHRAGVVVDVCALHGVWFDVGELPRVLAFVERGGLEIATREEAEHERERRIRDRTSSLVPAPGTRLPTPEAETLADGVAVLLDAVWAALRL